MSDQDFFFDEEDEKPAKPAKSATSADRPAASKTPAAPAVGGSSFFDQTITMSVAALLVLCALLVGVVTGVLVERGRGAGAVPTADGSAPSQSGGPSAPQLTPDQINAGQLPPGHPSVGASGAPASRPATGK